MNIYTPIIFEEVFTDNFTPNPTTDPWDMEWIGQFSLTSQGLGGEILEVTVDATGSPGVKHGIRNFAMYIANYDFTSLITMPRTVQTGLVGPNPGQVIFYSGNIAVSSDEDFDNTYPLYNQSFTIPVPYVSGANTKLAFLANGTNLNTNLRISIRGRRTQ